MEIECEVQKKGGKFLVLIPDKFVMEEKIRPKDKVKLSPQKKSDLSEIFGTLKTNLTAQELKDIAREGWGK